MPKKGAKAIEEDFSDLPTLPELNTLIFTMLYEFKDKERKQQVIDKIKEKWADKVKVITKEDIIEYGKKKLTIAEDEDVNNIEKVAQAASEKLFEQFVNARREKKEKIAQKVEEAKATATEENPDPQPNIDPNEIDCYFYMPDYPKNAEEASALNKFKYSLNTLIHLEEKPTIIEKKTDPELDEEGNPIEGTEQVIMEEAEIPEANRIPEEEIQNQLKLIESLKDALKSSEKDSAIRTFVTIKKEYNHKIVEPVPAEEGTPEEELTDENRGFNSLEEMAKEVVQTLNKTAQNLIRYKKFKQSAKLVPLKVVPPEPEKESRLGKEDEAEDEEEKEPQEEIKEDEKSKLAKAKEDKSKVDKSKSPEEEPKPVEPEPVVETTLEREWNDESYKSVVNDLPEDKKSIAGLLSACMINVCEELEKQNKIIEEDQEIVEEDEYKYIFDDDLNEIASSQGFAERNIMSATESVFSKEAGKSMFSSAYKSRESWNQDVVLDSQDYCAHTNDCVLMNGDNISTIEAGIYSYLRIPGVDRTNMPSFPEKSSLRRNAEKPEVYPFCTIPIEEFERALLLKTIEDQFKAKEPDYDWDLFERCIEEKYSKKALAQEISDALLWEPDTVAKYFSRDDSLLLGIYQKLPADKSYTKQWKSQYKSMPDFSNWLDFFSKDGDAQVPLYDIDDNKVGQVKEFTQNLTPSNGGLMRIKKLCIGLDEYIQTECFKDGLIFGIHAKSEVDDLSDNFWLNFDRNTRLDFRHYQGCERYFTPLPEEPNLPTEVEGEEPPADDEEAANLRKQKEEEKAKQEEERLALMNEEHDQYRLKGSGATLSFNTGNLIDLLPNGYVMQSKSNSQRKIIDSSGEIQEDFEESRVITGKSLIRYLAKGKIEILHSNGNFSVYDPETDLWTITNNSGKRRCKRQSDGHQFDIDPIPAAYETCGETNARVLFKEDNVISVEYPNGTRYTVHHDGTKIISNADQSEIVYEKIGFPLVKVLKGEMLSTEESPTSTEISDAEKEFYESIKTSRTYLQDRIKDQTVIQTYMNDRSVIQSFVEIEEFGTTQQPEEPHFDMEGEGEIAPVEEQKQDTAQDTNQNQTQEVAEGEGQPEMDQKTPVEEGPHLQAVHLVFRQDLSVTKISSEGEACVISGPTRLELNKAGNLQKIGRDTDYLLELFELRSQDRKGGIFTCMLNSSKIITHDKDKNYFEIRSNGTFEKVLAPEVSEVGQVEEHHEEDMEGVEMEQEQDPEQDDNSKVNKSKTKSNIPNINMSKSKTNAANTVPVNPRIFWIKVDGTGSEFLTKDRMVSETDRIGHDVEIVKTTQLLGQNPVQMHSYFTEYKTGEEIDQEFSVVAGIQAEEISDYLITGVKCIPKNVQEYPQMFREMIEKPKSKVYLFKNYIQHKDFDYFKRNAFHDDLERYKKWKEDSEASCVKRLGLYTGSEEAKDSFTPPEREIDQRIITKIYRERQIKKIDYGYKEIKDMGIQSVTDLFRNVRGKEDDQIKVQEQSSKKSESQDPAPGPQKEPLTAKGEKTESLTLEKIPEPSKSIDPSFDVSEPRRKRTVIIREEIADLKKEPYFVPNYFDTHFGKLYIQENPPKPPNEEVMLRMSQRMSRSIGATEGAHSQEAERISQYTGQNYEEMRKTGDLGMEEEDDMDNNAIVALEPEEDDNQDQMRMTGASHLRNSHLQESLEEPQYVPSNYLQEKEMIKQREETQVLKAEEYHVSKTKEFNVYGKLRPLKLKVKSIAKSKLKPEMNEKFITTECITDKRIKISSMANRAYQNAPSINQVRKQGQHQMILQAIQKKQTFNELIGQSNAMVTSVLNDPMKRSVNILPSEASFGSIREGSKFEVLITCKNEDMLPQRVIIRQSKDPRIRIVQENGGPIASGMIKNIRVVIDTSKPSDNKVVSDSFEIVTKTDVYRIPITATIHTEEQFDEINAESMKIHNKSAMKSSVRQLFSRKKQRVGDMLQTLENKGWIETTGSESKLPSLPNINNRAFEPDAQMKLDEVIEKQSNKAPSRRESQGSRMSRRTLGSKRSNRQ